MGLEPTPERKVFPTGATSVVFLLFFATHI